MLFKSLARAHTHTHIPPISPLFCKKKNVSLAFFFVTAVFDIIHSDLLLRYLKHIVGICDGALSWFSSALRTTTMIIVGCHFSQANLF